MAISCHAREPIVNGGGVGDLLIGRVPPHFAGNRLVSREWQEDGNGERYESLTVRFVGIPVEAEVHNGRIWRISLMRRGLRTRDGSQVGDSVQELLRANRSLRREIGPGPSLVLVQENFCGISYVIDADMPDSVLRDPTRKLPPRYAKNARIGWIFVTGCRK